MTVVRHETEHHIENPVFGDLFQKIGERANNTRPPKQCPAVLKTDGERRGNPSAITVSRQAMMFGPHYQLERGLKYATTCSSNKSTSLRWLRANNGVDLPAGETYTSGVAFEWAFRPLFCCYEQGSGVGPNPAAHRRSR